VNHSAEKDGRRSCTGRTRRRSALPAMAPAFDADCLSGRCFDLVLKRRVQRVGLIPEPSWHGTPVELKGRTRLNVFLPEAARGQPLVLPGVYLAKMKQSEDG